MKKYQIIYADPPWPIKIISRRVRPKQLDMPYKIMTLEDICNLPIQSITNPDECSLFLWTTHKYLPKAFEVMNRWGFSYNCTITWNKTYGFTPFSFMWSTEFILYGQLKDKWVRQPGNGGSEMSERLSERERIKGLRRTDFNIALQRLAKSDCGDNSCIFAGKGKGGMRTNGGCRCYQMLTNDIVALIEADRARIVEPFKTIKQKIENGIVVQEDELWVAMDETLKRAGGE